MLGASRKGPQLDRTMPEFGQPDGNRHASVVGAVSSILSKLTKVGVKQDDLVVTRLLKKIDDCALDSPIDLNPHVASASHLHESARLGIFRSEVVLGLAQCLLADLFDRISAASRETEPTQQARATDTVVGGATGAAPQIALSFLGESLPTSSFPRAPATSFSSVSHTPQAGENSPSIVGGGDSSSPGPVADAAKRKRQAPQVSERDRRKRRAIFWPKNLVDDRNPWLRFRQFDFLHARGRALGSWSLNGMRCAEFTDECELRCIDASNAIDNPHCSAEEMSACLSRLGFPGRVRAESIPSMRSRLRAGFRRWRKWLVEGWGYCFPDCEPTSDDDTSGEVKCAAGLSRSEAEKIDPSLRAG